MKKRILAAVLTPGDDVQPQRQLASAANNVIRTEDVKISVDGKAIDVPKGSIWISEDGYTMVGARALAEGFGAKTPGTPHPHRRHHRHGEEGGRLFPRGRL